MKIYFIVDLFEKKSVKSVTIDDLIRLHDYCIGAISIGKFDQIVVGMTNKDDINQYLCEYVDIEMNLILGEFNNHLSVKYRDVIDLNHYIVINIVDVEFIRENINYLSFDTISLYGKLDIDFIEEYKDAINWERFIYNIRTDKKIIGKYKNYFK